MHHIFIIKNTPDNPFLDWLGQHFTPAQFRLTVEPYENKAAYVLDLINHEDLAIQFKLMFSDVIESCIVW